VNRSDRIISVVMQTVFFFAAMELIAEHRPIEGFLCIGVAISFSLDNRG
jgi:hypothetical protein